MKKLIICADGTCNHPDKVVKGSPYREPSNIVKIARAITPSDDEGIPQIVYYYKGIGVNKSGKFWDGFTGRGLDENIQACYRFLAHNYESGDKVFLFGFSRGAYTVRSLTGLIELCGLLEKGDIYFTPEAYKCYRSKDKKDLDAYLQALNKEPRKIDIHFIGVFDTVGARGIPLGIFQWFNKKRHGFHSHHLPKNVAHAFHAIALDEKRKPYVPTLWESKEDNQRLEQRWFPGVHTNVGGGYPKDGIGNYPLHWILKRAITLKDSPLKLDYKIMKYSRPYAGDPIYENRGWIMKIFQTAIRKLTLNEWTFLDQSIKKVKASGNHQKYSPSNLPENPNYADSLRVYKADLVDE